MPKTRTILIYGSTNFQLAGQLAQHFGSVGIVCPWRGDYLLGYLHMTDIDPKKLHFVHGVEFLSLTEALKEMNG